MAPELTTETSRPVLGVSALVRHRGRVLLVKRKRPPFEGYWSLPGGHVERGELLADAAAREVREETGVAVDRLRQIDLQEIVTQDGAGGTASHFVLVVFKGEYRAGAPKAGDDAAEARWVEPAELGGLKMTDQSRRVIEFHSSDA